MSRFTLLVVPGGRAILTTTEQLSDQSILGLRDIVKGWKDGEWPVLTIPDCEVVQVSEIDLDLEPVPAGVLD